MKMMEDYFNDEAVEHDDLFIKKMGWTSSTMKLKKY